MAATGGNKKQRGCVARYWPTTGGGEAMSWWWPWPPQRSEVQVRKTSSEREGREKVYPRRGESGRAGDEVAAGAATDGVGAGAPRVEVQVR